VVSRDFRKFADTRPAIGEVRFIGKVDHYTQYCLIIQS
jgi:hypothetical protein